ncbi:hypothetical protein GCM10011348_33500 [Marinobacterium nitratireducens]|uniref:DUF1302 domain-containing protein n=1 Tax=Marinobacterium nitratireducens TaxID=518897 RepID=A0A918DUY8_9GAMM|nr:DUF1302 family protein [Marinobacterium nitratireducens]GGO85301.1 hypothetical protein GCM10011348_33500 [Marinobacterium nitratireducens]
MQKSIHLKRLPLAVAVLSGMLGLAKVNQAEALQLDFGEDSELSGSLDFTLGYAAAIRASDAKSAALDPTNNLLGSGATPNYLSDARVPDAGDLISSVFKGTAELGLGWRNYGFVGTATYQYDSEIMDGDSVDFLGNPAPWSKAAEDYAGSDLELLDAYVYGSFEVGGNPLDLRLGKQVINWGEGLYFLDGVSVQVPLNINKLVTPGSELKEGYIGVNSVYAQLGIGDSSSLSAYLQTDWERAEFGPRGTFYGDDVLFRGGTETDPLLGVPIRDNDVEPDEGGQWGIAGRTFVTDDTELGLYYSHYHETFPFLQLAFPSNSATGLRQIWPEDLDMYGASFATTLGTWSLNGELAYRPDRPLWTNLATFDAKGRNIEKHDTVNASVHGIWLGGALPLGIDAQLLTVQFGADYIDGDLDNLQAHNSIHSEALSPDRLSYGVAAQWNGTWQAIYPGTDLTLGLFLQKDLQGNSHFWGNFAEDRLLGTLSLTANIGNAWEARAGYTWVNQDNSNYESQDVVNLSVNYKF